MEVFGQLLSGLQTAISLQNCFVLLIGVTLGVIVGILPGLGPSAGIAILIPLTLGMPSTTAIILLSAIYYGAMYGGSITSILINLPGESASVAATFDGYPLARQGRVGPALVMQAFANFIGGMIGILLLTLLIRPISYIARSFGPSELLMMAIIGLIAIVAIVGKDRRHKGAISAMMGLALGTSGVDLASGAPRFTFGVPDLLGGVSFVAVVIGLFGIGEVLQNILDGQHKSAPLVHAADMRREFWPSRNDWKESRFTFVRASLIGFIVGVVPGAGASVAAFIAYAVEKSVSKVRAKFGSGAMPGLVAVEASISAFILWGLTPGPLLMTEHAAFAWGLIGSLYYGNIALLIICVGAIPVFALILKLRYIFLVPAIIVLCAIGTYAVSSSYVDVGLMMALGVVGVLMKRHGYSPAATVVAFVLGPMTEKTLRQTLAISAGDPSWMLSRPYTLGLVAIILAVVAFQIAAWWRAQPRYARSEAGS